MKPIDRLLLAAIVALLAAHLAVELLRPPTAAALAEQVLVRLERGAAIPVDAVEFAPLAGAVHVTVEEPLEVLYVAGQKGDTDVQPCCSLAT